MMPLAPKLTALSQKQLHTVAATFDPSAATLTCAARSYRWLLAGYYNLLIPADASVLEVG